MAGSRRRNRNDEINNTTIANQVITDMEEFLEIPYATLPRITISNSSKNSSKTDNDTDSTRIQQDETTDNKTGTDAGKATTTSSIMNIISGSAKYSFVQERLINICESKYDPIRKELLESGRKASLWIEHYLLHHYSYDNDDNIRDGGGDENLINDDDETKSAHASGSGSPLSTGPAVIVSQPQDFLERIRQWRIDPGMR